MLNVNSYLFNVYSTACLMQNISHNHTHKEGCHTCVGFVVQRRATNAVWVGRVPSTLLAYM